MTVVRTTIRVGIAVALLAALTACSGARREVMAFEGVVFKAKATSTRADRKAFDIAVSPVSASLEGARQAGLYEATKYCVRGFGSSDIVWEYAPDAPEASLVIAEDTLLLRGRCAR